MPSTTGVGDALETPQLPEDFSFNLNFIADVTPASALLAPTPGTPIPGNEESDMEYQEPDSPSLRVGHAVKRKRLAAFSKCVQAPGERPLDRALTPDEEGSLVGGGIWVGSRFSRFDEPENLQLKAAETKAAAEAKAKAEVEVQAERMRIKHEAMVGWARRVKEDKEWRLREAEQHRLFAIEVQEGTLLNVAFQRG
ncbi:hypothetical protein FRB98_002195 [Tulasnella sp. 332]|nr:hypothetical protein FRB98_002195 [Tulasnella sp. 332]